MYAAALTAFVILVVGHFMLKAAAVPVLPDGVPKGARARAKAMSIDESSKSESNPTAGSPSASDVSDQLASLLGLPSLSSPVEKELAALRVSITNIDEIKAKLSLGELFAFENAYYGKLIKVVETFQGEIDHFDGTSALLVFGRLLKLDDHHGEARGAAFATRRLILNELEETLPKDVKPQVKVALAAGMAIAGPVGMDYRKVYTVFGGPVDLLPALLAKANDGEIAINTKGFEELHDVEGIRREGDEVFLPEGVEYAPPLEDDSDIDTPEEIEELEEVDETPSTPKK